MGRGLKNKLNIGLQQGINNALKNISKPISVGKLGGPSLILWVFRAKNIDRIFKI